jgi:DNA repair photolyase
MEQVALFRAPPMAAPSHGLPVLDTRLRGTMFVQHGVKTVVNAPECTGMEFWSLNPFVGCELGCAYCYAHYAHRYVMERARDRGLVNAGDFAASRGPNGWEAFEKRIFVKSKTDVLNALDRDLSRIVRRQHRAPQSVVIGTATDPYQPAERRFGITRAVLDRLLMVRHLSLGIITKSPLISRDIDLLQALGRHNRVTVYISLIGVDSRTIRIFEARSPLPHVRLRTLRTLRDADVNAGLLVAPVLPGITDSVFHVNALMRAAKNGNATFVQPVVLRLYPAVRQRLIPIIEAHFPNLAARYRAAYGRSHDAPAPYTRAVGQRFGRCGKRYGLDATNPLDRPAVRSAQLERHSQLSLL